MRRGPCIIEEFGMAAVCIVLAITILYIIYLLIKEDIDEKKLRKQLSDESKLEKHNS